MKVRAITKLKNGAIVAALEKRGWTQSDLARAVGYSPQSVGDAVNMKLRRAGDGVIQAIAFELQIPIDVVSPPELREWGGPNVIHRDHDVEPTLLLEAGRGTQRLLLSSPEENMEAEEMRDEIRAAVGEVWTDHHREALRMRYGLDGRGPRSFKDIGRALKVTQERARQMVLIAERRIGQILERKREPRP